MTLPLPLLDDLNFDQLVEEARGLIPRYAPEWTDHNVHDPGITLLELAAWLVDQDLYQLGFISDKHIQAFAALLGVRPGPAVPAEGLVWPADRALSDDPSRPGLNLNKGGRVSCKELPNIPFQLADNLHISPAQILSIKGAATGNNPDLQSQTATWLAAARLANTQSGTNSPEGLIDIVFDRPLVEQEELTGDGTNHPIALGLELNDPLDTPPETDLPGHTVVEYRLDLPAEPWRRIEVVADSTRALNRTGLLLLQIPAEPLLENRKYRSHLRIFTRRKSHTFTPELTRLAINVVPVVQLEERPTQAFPQRSNGLPDQSYGLLLEGLITDPLVLEVEEEDKWIPWYPVEDLSRQGPHNRVFSPDIQRETITFGNGINGAIPPLGAQIRHRAYVLTQGQVANLVKGLSWSVPGAPMRVDNLFGTNLCNLSSGRNASSLDDLRVAARRSALERRIALTNKELLEAVQNIKWLGIERAQILTHYLPSLPGRAVTDTRTLVIVPARPATADPFAPTPPSLLQAVKQHLEPQRVLGERLVVSAFVPVPIRVKAHLVIDDEVDERGVLGAAEQQLNARLSDIQVAGSELVPWPLGRPVTPEEIKTLLALVPGVIAVPQCQIAREDREFQDATIILAADELAVGSSHQLWQLDSSQPFATAESTLSGRGQISWEGSYL